MISFLDLKQVNAKYEAALKDKMADVLNSGWYILGSELHLFETNFSYYCGTKFCIGVGNGFDALVLILKGYIELGKLKKGDEIMVPANTYIASILAILEADLVPILIEPTFEDFNIDPTKVKKRISTKTKGILLVHLYGQLANIELIKEIATANKLLVIEDAAQAHGAIFKSTANFHLNNRKSGNLGDAAAFSFYPGKNLGALGDGGAITTNDEDLANILFELRNYGSKKKYVHNYMGVNSRLDELQAAFLNVKLPFLDIDNEIRRNIAKKYISEIKNPKILLPFWDYSENHVFHLFVIRTKRREELRLFLLENNIQTLIHYPIPPHKQVAFSNWNSKSYPITEQIHNEVLSLPISPVLTENEVEYIINILNKWTY